MISKFLNVIIHSKKLQFRVIGARASVEIKMLYLWPWNLSLAIASIYGLILIDDNTIIQYNITKFKFSSFTKQFLSRSL